MPRKKKSSLSAEHIDMRSACEKDLEQFVQFVYPRLMLANVHRRIIRNWTREEALKFQLLLLPRDHMKSTLLGLRMAWNTTRDPTSRQLIISSTSNLATKQLKFIKDILTSPNYRILWPEMVNEEEAKREKWTEREISVDHPLRKEWSIRDPSIFTAGLTTNVVGLHADFVGLDDVVVASNAYTEEGRSKVKEQYGYLSSVESANACECVVGTRYHPLDLYGDMLERQIETFDERGRVKERVPLFEVIQEQVESIGDGTGEFLWPRSQGSEGKWFGFDSNILATKRQQYSNPVHFRAQYYNDPQDLDSSPIKRDKFQYFDGGHLIRRDGKWFFKDKRLNVFASIDFAYTTGKKSDYTSIVVLGVDGDSNYYVLEIERFKTDSPSVYFAHILKLYEKWGFRKLRAEVSAAQVVIVKSLKEDYIRPYGLSLSVEEYKPSRWEGAKQERIMATLEPKYNNFQMWHYQGGNCQLLEEELMFANPAHDDIKDALASCVDLAIPPMNLFNKSRDKGLDFSYNSRFGGTA